jgi:hypothetical protein
MTADFQIEVSAMFLCTVRMFIEGFLTTYILNQQKPVPNIGREYHYPKTSVPHLTFHLSPKQPQEKIPNDSASSQQHLLNFS